MLKFQSFDFADSDGINALLENNRLAAGAHILVSDGKIVLPYEDGEPNSNAHRILGIKEQKNTLIAQMDIITHSQKVLDFLIADADSRINTFKADLAEAKTNKGGNKGEIQNHITQGEKAREQLVSQKLQNDHEILRMNINIQFFDEQIEELEGIRTKTR